MYYLKNFKHFVSIFPSFSIQLTPFSIYFKFLILHFYKSLDPIGSIFFSCAVPGYLKFDEVPLPLRHHARLTMMYKMIHGLAAVQYQQYIIPVERESRHTGSYCFQSLHSHTDYHHNSFFPRTVSEWNNLPRQCPCLPSEDGWPACRPI